MSDSERHQGTMPVENNRYSEILNNAELCSEYRTRLAGALRLVTSYTGKESEFKAMMKVLIDLENWLKDVFGISTNFRLPADAEQKVLESWHPSETRRKIDDLLSLAQNSYEKAVSRSLHSSSKPESKSDILTVQLDGIILPPAFSPAIGHGNGEKRVEDSHFKERLKSLILTLSENGIYADDIILISGNLDKTMMRKESYTIVEIPKLNREILVCDQVGEATFVIYGILGRNTLMSASKEDLQVKFGARVVRITHHNDLQWQSVIFQSLLKDIDVESLKKIDVKTQEGLCSEIIKLKPTPQSWSEMIQKERRQFKISGIGLMAIATKFAIKRNPIKNRSVHLELGRKIYGEEHECLQNITLEQLTQEILKLKPTPESWADMIQKEKEQFKISGIGLRAIATKFGVKGNSVANRSVHLELGRKIYGEEHECLQNITLEQLTQKILKLKPTPESWADMIQKEKEQFKIFSMGLIAIARKFSVKGKPIGNLSAHLELGKKIYGEEHECLQCKEKPDLTSEEIRQEILKLKPTPESWADMSGKEKGQFKISGIGLRAITTKFGVKGNPVNNHSIHLELGKRIYGEAHECLQCKEKPDLTSEEIRQEILKPKPTPESWADMTYKKKLQFKIFGIGLTAIATKFDIKGNPVNNHSIHLELGRKIYGEGHECLNSKS